MLHKKVVTCYPKNGNSTHGIRNTCHRTGKLEYNKTLNFAISVQKWEGAT